MARGEPPRPDVRRLRAGGWLAALLLPVALLTSAGAHLEVFSCSMDRAVHARSCCSHKHHAAPAQDSVGRRDCCTGVEMDATPAPAQAGVARVVVDAPPAVALVALALPARAAPLPTGDAPPLTPRSTAGPPLHLKNCALLI